MSLTYSSSHSPVDASHPASCHGSRKGPAPTIGHWLADLGLLADGMGLAAVEEDIDVLVATARGSGVDSAAVAVLADRGASEVVRLRAFAKVSADVIAAKEISPRPSTHR